MAESDSLGLNKNFKTPTSPLRIVNSNEIGVNVNNLVQRIESPVSREDEEVLEIVKQGEMEENSIIRQCDSVLQESEGGRGKSYLLYCIIQQDSSSSLILLVMEVAKIL